jgi:hypothetical protein
VAIAFEPLPLVIGVTGHFDLRETDLPLLRQEVEAVFDRLEREYANPLSSFARRREKEERGERQAGATPMIVLSSLAGGADQLVVRAALARGLQVIATLPLPVDAYRRDFEWDIDRPETMGDFEAWMARPDIHKLFVGYEKGNSPDNVRPMGHQRNLQYRRAGAFIARHCDVLIALWDGKADTMAGCPAEIVGFKRHGIPLDASGSARASLDAPETGPVIHIVTPRAMTKNTASAVAPPCWGAGPVRQARDAARKTSPPYEVAALDHDCELWLSFEASVRQSREFNREADRLLASAAGRTAASQSFMGLFEVDAANPETRASALKASTVAPRRCVLYAVADALAQRRQRVFWRDWRAMSGLALLAFACVEAFSRLAPAQGAGTVPLAGIGLMSGGLLLMGLLTLGAAAVVYTAAIRRRHQERLLDYRSLAEVLRTAVFWNFAGLDGAAHAWPARMPRELAWAQTCLRRQELFDLLFDRTVPSGSSARPALTPVSYDWIRRMWIKGQLRYFTSGRSQYVRATRWRGIAVAAIVTVTAILAAVALLLASRGGFDQDLPAHALLLFAITMLPGMAAVLAGYAAALGFNTTVQRHDRMVDVFGRALTILPPALDAENADLVRDVVRDVGAEAMRETASWLSTSRPRRINLRQE